MGRIANRTILDDLVLTHSTYVGEPGWWFTDRGPGRVSVAYQTEAAAMAAYHRDAIQWAQDEEKEPTDEDASK